MATTTKKAPSLVDDLGQEFELQFKDVNIAENAETGQILLPKEMQLAEGIHWLKTKQKEQETLVAVRERIEGYPIDVSHALQLAVKQMFGIRELHGSGFFGMNPPQFQSVPINVKGDMVEIFTGEFSLPGIEGTIATGRDWNDALIIQGSIKQKSVPKFRKLLVLTKQLLLTHSLYKGQAIRVKMTKQSNMFEEKVTMADPEFMDTTQMPAELMLNPETRELLEAALWTPIERSEQTKFYGGNLKRTILLEGPYGTGKSLTALETARRAVPAGWTFIYLTNVSDLKRMYPFAVRYAPSVMFAEDIDTIVNEEDEDTKHQAVQMLNNVLDGIDSKSSDIILVLTSNHVEKLPQSLIRHGRFDTMVTYTRPDPDTAMKLVTQYAGNTIDTEDFDPARVGRMLAGNQPATIHEVVKRAKLFSQRRYPSDYRGALKLSTDDMVLSNDSIQRHLSLLNKEPETTPAPMQVLGEAIGSYIERGVISAQKYGRDAVLEVSDEEKRQLATPGRTHSANGR